jgi:anti-sigma-K factor RskA
MSDGQRRANEAWRQLMSGEAFWRAFMAVVAGAAQPATKPEPVPAPSNVIQFRRRA